MESQEQRRDREITDLMIRAKSSERNRSAFETSSSYAELLDCLIFHNVYSFKFQGVTYTRKDIEGLMHHHKIG